MNELQVIFQQHVFNPFSPHFRSFKRNFGTLKTIFLFIVASFILKLSYIYRSLVMKEVLGQKFPQMIVVDDDENHC